MADIIYKKYEENKGFEKYQAEIYNSIATKHNARTFTAESIDKRLHDHKPEQDRNGMTFAFTSDMKPIAYIQYREYAQGKVRIGYPWAIDGTPQEVKDKLFYDLFEYLKKKYPETKKFYLGFLNHAFADIIEDIKSHYQFKEDSTFASYTFDVAKASAVPLPDEYSFKEASEDNLELLIGIALSDNKVGQLGKGRIEDFFKTRFFTQENKDRLSMIFLKNNENIGMVALSKTTERDVDYSSIRMLALKRGEEVSYKFIISALAKFLLSKEWNYPISMNFDKTQKKEEETVKNLGATFVSKAFEFVYEL